MIIGYARVSDKSQSIDRQIIELENYGVDKIFQETFTGKDFQNRGELQNLLSFARSGDSIVVDDLERLGRDYSKLVEVIHQLDLKGINLIVINLPFLNSNETNNITGKLVRGVLIQVLSWVAEQNRIDIKRKQAQGIALAKEKGVYKGTKRNYSSNAVNPQKRIVYNQVILMLYEGVSISEISRKTGVSRPTVYKIKNDIQTIDYEY